MKKRKIFSLFAILFVAVFALSCCFLFACNKEEDEEPEVPGVENPEDKSDDEEKKEDDTEKKDDDTETEGSAIDQRVYAATKEGDHAYLTFDADSNIYFDDCDISVEASSEAAGTINYKITGTAGVMDEDQANAFWSGVAEEGDAYICYKILVNSDESITYTDVYRGEETLTNSENEDAAYFDNDYFYVIERISGVDQSGNELSGKGMTYTISDGTTTTEHIISIAVNIPSGEALEEIASWDFSDTTKFSASTSLDATAPTADTANVKETTVKNDGESTTVYYIETSLKYADGTETGLTCMQSSSKQTKIDGGDIQRVDFGGGIFTYQSCLIYSLTTGTYSVTMSYYSGNAGRYATIIDSEGEPLIDTAEATYQTVARDESKSGAEQYTVVTRTVTLEIESDMDIYIGSGNSGLYLTFLSISK